MNLSLYLHIPFCVEKCRYCDFVSFPSSTSLIPRYVDTLIAEMHHEGPRDGDSALVETIYFGGGTPSLLTPSQVELILEEVGRRFVIPPDPEVTMEVNPGTVSVESLSGYRRAGVNRLSIGVQSLDDNLLRLLGRIHSRREALMAYDAARRAGFENISLDLIHSVPGMTAGMWRTILREALLLSPEHLSAYALTAEEGTPLRSDVEQGHFNLPDDDAAAEMFDLAGELCEAAGLFRYEISNHARPGFHSRHNSRYWQRGYCLGCGVAAHSFLPLSPWGTRFSRTGSLTDYLREGERGVFPHHDSHDLTRREAAEETLFLGLRMTDGIDRAGFESLFGVDPCVMFPVIERLSRQGLLLLSPGRVRIPPRRLSVSNRILAEFV